MFTSELVHLNAARAVSASQAPLKPPLSHTLRAFFSPCPSSKPFSPSAIQLRTWHGQTLSRSGGDPGRLGTSISVPKWRRSWQTRNVQPSSRVSHFTLSNLRQCRASNALLLLWRYSRPRKAPSSTSSRRKKRKPSSAASATARSGSWAAPNTATLCPMLNGPSQLSASFTVPRSSAARHPRSALSARRYKARSGNALAPGASTLLPLGQHALHCCHGTMKGRRNAHHAHVKYASSISCKDFACPLPSWREEDKNCAYGWT